MYKLSKMVVERVQTLYQFVFVLLYKIKGKCFVISNNYGTLAVCLTYKVSNKSVDL